MGIGSFIQNTGIAKRAANERLRQDAEDAYNTEARALNLEAKRAENAMLPARTAAERARLGVETATANANLPLVGQRAALAGTQLRVAQGEATQAEKEQPLAFGIRTQQHQLQAKQLQGQLAKEEVNLELLPGELAKMRQQGLLDDMQGGQRMLAGLHYALASDPGDGQVFLKYANAALKNGWVPGMEQEEVTGAKMEEVQENGQPIKVLSFVTKSGKPLQVRWDRVQQAVNSIGPRELKVLNKGDTLVSVGPTGESRTVASAPAWDVKDGVAFNAAGENPDTRVVKGAAAPGHKEKIKRAEELLDTTYGVKRDAMGSLLNPDVVQDGESYQRDQRELSARIDRGEDPIAVATEINQRAIKGKKLGRTAPAPKGSSAVDNAASRFGF